MARKIQTFENPKDMEILVGRTEVRCMAVQVNPLTGKSQISEIKRGVITQNFGTFVRVFDYRKPSQGGDCHINGEVLPLRGKTCWCEIIDVREPKDAFRVPPEFRH